MQQGLRPWLSWNAMSWCIMSASADLQSAGGVCAVWQSCQEASGGIRTGTSYRKLVGDDRQVRAEAASNNDDTAPSARLIDRAFVWQESTPHHLE